MLRRVDESAGGTTFKRWYPLTDGQFSVRAVLREDGGVHERVNYSPYGVAEHHWGSDVDNDRSADFFDWLAIADQVSMGSVGIGQANYVAEMDLNRDGVLDSDDANAIVTGTALPSGWISASGAGHPGNVIGFDGYVFNPEIETYSVRFRWYDPELGRWLQRDVLEYPDGMNRYQYGLSTPPNTVDPSGLNPPDFVRQWGISQEHLDACYAGGWALHYAPDPRPFEVRLRELIDIGSDSLAAALVGSEYGTGGCGEDCDAVQDALDKIRASNRGLLAQRKDISQSLVNFEIDYLFGEAFRQISVDLVRAAEYLSGFRSACSLGNAVRGRDPLLPGGIRDRISREIIVEGAWVSWLMSHLSPSELLDSVSSPAFDAIRALDRDMADTVKALAEIDDAIRRNREVANMLEELLESLNCGEGASDGQ